MMAEVCPKCDGMGMVVARLADGRFAAEACECRHQLRADALLERARIPKRYQHCLFESYETGSMFDSSLVAAKLTARQ
ncbi:MAG TPA: DNA replication protein DnaC, partial [Acidobacteriaceae bacterium]|nr:DNA replication protein DnaC [Acidobacteriaceae bacterium]